MIFLKVMTYLLSVAGATYVVHPWREPPSSRCCCCREFVFLIKCYCCQDVWVCDILYVSLTKSINIDPVGVILSLVLTSTCLAFRWDFLHWTLWRLIVFSWLSCWFWHPFSSINDHFTTCSWHLLLNLLILELVHICHLWLLILGFNIARGFVIDFHKLF